MDFKTLSAVFLLSLALLSSAAYARDTAVVVGVNRYENLPPNKQLRGCVADAEAMRRILEGNYGFHVISLTDSTTTKPTKQQILQAIREAASSMSASDKFVFYFSGHGSLTLNLVASIVPTDAVGGSPDTAISVSELYNAISSLPAHAKSIILDSCHSGGMQRSLSLAESEGFRVRFVDLRKSGLGIEEGPNNADGGDQFPGSSKICYFTACQRNQFSLETSIGGQVRGLFTHSLEDRLKGGRELWGDILSTTTESVNKLASEIGEAQTPQLSPGFSDKIHIRNDAGQDLVLSNLAEVYNLNNANGSLLNVNMSENVSSVALNSGIHLTITARQDGYLIVLNHDPNGKVKILFPKSSVDEGKVTGSLTIGLPAAGRIYYCRVPGIEHVKGILFRSREDAEKVLNAFGVTRASSRGGLAGLRLEDEIDVSTSISSQGLFVTSELTFEVKNSQ